MILVVSDVHARLRALQELLYEVNERYDLAKFDKIVFLGDHIGYGMETMETLEYLRAFREKYVQTAIVKGNWEDIITSFYNAKNVHIKNHYQQMLKKMNQLHVLEAFEQHPERDEWIDFLNRMPLFYIYKRYCFVHAGADFSLYEPTDTMEDFLERQPRKELLWKNTMYGEVIGAWQNHMEYGDQEHPITGLPYTFIFGHLSLPTVYRRPNFFPNVPLVVGNTFGIDFGAAKENGKLGAVIFKGKGFESITVTIQEEDI